MTDASGRLSVLAVLGALLLGACGTSGEAIDSASLPAPRGELVLEFDEGLNGEGDSMDRVQSSGTATLRIKVASHGGGMLERVRGRSGYAVKTPAFVLQQKEQEPAREQTQEQTRERAQGQAQEQAQEQAQGRAEAKSPAAVLVVRARGADQLSPGDRPVRWGLDVMLDAEQGESASDNGDNALQRGLFDDSAQVKLQLDHGVPSCRVRGDAGEALVKADVTLERERWHRIHCLLRNGSLSLLVGEPGRPSPQEWSTPAEVGAITFRRSEPVAIGGKVDPSGRIKPGDTDQLNGLLDNVFMDILR